MTKIRIKDIDCDATAVAGIQTALTKRFDEMYKLRSEALKWSDPEGVHSMRVASRRLRSAAKDFLPYVKNRDLTDSLKKIRSIADALGKVRDQDVAIMELENLSSQTPAEVGAVVQELISARKKGRNTARHELKEILLKSQLKELRSDFESALNKLKLEPSRTSHKSGKSEFSYIDVARAIIRDRLSEFEKLSTGLYHPRKVKPVHEMRIAAKRLRYAIELFEDCFDSSIASFAKHASEVQSALGMLHDCDVWIDSFGEEIIASKKLKHHEQSQAFVWIFSHFSVLRNQQFREAFSSWDKWDSESLSDKLKDALKSRDQTLSNGPSGPPVVIIP